MLGPLDRLCGPLTNGESRHGRRNSDGGRPCSSPFHATRGPGTRQDRFIFFSGSAQAIGTHVHHPAANVWFDSVSGG